MTQQQKADLIISGNAVYTGVSDQPEPLWIAIRGNQIMAVGKEEEIEHYRGEKTEVRHYQEGLVMAGFHDFHLHILQGALALASVDLSTARSREEALSMIRAFAEDHPDKPWIFGFTWDAAYWADKRLPDRRALDGILPDRPAIMFHVDGHYAWVNSKALEAAGIDRDTENPSYGTIEKDEQGEPNGILYEKAMSLVTDRAYQFTQEQKAEIFTQFLRHAASLGITAVHDMFGTDSLEIPGSYEIFKEFEDADQLTLRIHLWPELNGDLEEAGRLRDKFRSDKLKMSGLKQFIDGVVSACTAYMLEPYADAPDIRGETSYPPETLHKWVADADREGFPVRFHAIGDGAIRLALDAFEEARKANGPRDSRHGVEHIEVIHPDDIGRFKELGVTVSMQPDHFALSERGAYSDRIGDEREKYVFVINTLMRTGANVAFGTDFPIDDLNPLLQIYRAVTRVDSSGEDTWHPQERITLSEALKAYTKGPAYGCFREDELGTIEEGKFADIVVLEKNLFEIPPEEIKDVGVELTIADGKVTFDKING